MYKYYDAVQESLRKEAREIRDAHFEEIENPMRLAAKLEFKKAPPKELNRGYRFIHI